MTAVQMRRTLLVAIPVVLVVAFELRVWKETLGIICLTWMYNDLGGGSESFVSRNVIIACAYGVYNLGSLRVACGPGIAISERGVHWIVCVSGMILSTMHIQDLKDQRGDRRTGRSTIPLVFGDGVARWSVAVPVLVWSVVCPVYMNVGMVGFVAPCCLGIVTAGRVLRLKRPEDDQISWECWALWSISLYILPLVKYHEA
jgi:4-hydroxybenzoate polyprenyltransferase